MRHLVGGLTLAVLAAMPLAAQNQPAIRRVQPKAFPLSITPSLGLGFGAVRAVDADSIACGSVRCEQYGTGSGLQAELALQVPIGGTLGFEVGGQIGRPSRKSCLRGQCQSPDRTWAYRGTAVLLWRFKARAPIYFGVGGVIARFDPGPVLRQDGAVTEYGATTVVGFDFPLTGRLGGRIIWRSYILAPTDTELPPTYDLDSVAWDNAFTFGVRIPLGS